jgi:hypothetical protein
MANRRGRPPGSANKVDKYTKATVLEMIEDPEYLHKLRKRLILGKLRPAVECMLWYYAKGKPKEMVEHSGNVSLQQELTQLSVEELRTRALAVASMLKQQVKDSETRH